MHTDGTERKRGRHRETCKRSTEKEMMDMETGFNGAETNCRIVQFRYPADEQ